MEVAIDIFRFRTRAKTWPGDRLAAEARALGLRKIRAVRRSALYFVRATIAPKELCLLGRSLFSDPLVEDCEWEACGAEKKEEGRLIEIALRPGVTDPVAEEAMRAAAELGIKGIEAIGTGESFEIEGDDISRADLELLARRLLVNPVIHRYAIGRIEPSFPSPTSAGGEIEALSISAMDETGLMALSAERRSALDIAEMKALQAYFASENRDCTDAEFETIAQTWSEHCVHKTFKARIEVQGPAGSPYPDIVDNVLKTYIKRASDEIAAPWVISAFEDNAGIIAFDDEYEISFKVETHNHPSAVEPFGGANTGVGGVIRDVMGVSARPIAATDVLCFGPSDTLLEDLPAGVLHPRRVALGRGRRRRGLRQQDGHTHRERRRPLRPRLRGQSPGLLRLRGDSAPRQAQAGCPISGTGSSSLAGARGRDGIRGATFSSMVMDSSTGELAGASVQIGAPIVQKKTSEVILEARDAGLYTAITDCGAGGLSSAVGEMAEKARRRR